jgi:hypothetical protein
MNMLCYALFLFSYSMNSRVINKEYTHVYWLKLTLVLLAYLTSYELVQFVVTLVLERNLFYFSSFKNLAELSNFSCCFLALMISPDDVNLKSSMYSVTILLAYLVFLLRLDKIPHVGVYVMVFKQVLKKSFTVIPLVVILMTGFLFAFKIRSKFDSHQSELVTGSITNSSYDSANKIQKFNANLSYSIFVLIQMILADFDVEQLGLNDQITWANSANFFLFVLIMTIFMYNLFVGIAVAEISRMMIDAELQYIKFKIEYVLRFQSFFGLLTRHGHTLPLRWMIFTEYDKTKEIKLILFYKRSKKWISSLFYKQSKLAGKKLVEDYQGLNALKTDLELMKQDILLIRTSLMSDGSRNKIDQMSDQQQGFGQALADLKSALPEGFVEDLVLSISNSSERIRTDLDYLKLSMAQIATELKEIKSSAPGSISASSQSTINYNTYSSDHLKSIAYEDEETLSSKGKLTVKQLLDGEWLTDTEIECFLSILRNEFPHIDGLEDPLILKNRTDNVAIASSFIRVVNSGSNHWVCVASCANELDKGNLF